MDAPSSFTPAGGCGDTFAGIREVEPCSIVPECLPKAGCLVVQIGVPLAEDLHHRWAGEKCGTHGAYPLGKGFIGIFQA